MSFIQLLEQAKRDSGSKICVGLDLASHGSRNDYTIGEKQDKTPLLLSLISELSPFCCAFKINRQYILDLTLEEIKQVTTLSHEFQRPIIVDHKLSDIGSTNQQAVFHFSKEGFDAFTASPFPGNVKEVCETGQSFNLAVILLVLMSNPDALWMKNDFKEEIPFYQHYSRLANKFADGIVVGATGHVTEHELEIIRTEVREKVVLSPGIGPQGGNLQYILSFFEKEVIFNVGRGIIYQKDPVNALSNYNKQIHTILG